MEEAEIIREVAQSVADAIARNRRIETVLIAILSAFSLSGLLLIGVAVVARQWSFAVPGSLCELAILFPVRSLVTLRRENIRLQILPQMMRLARDAAERKIVFRFLEKIMTEIAK